MQKKCCLEENFVQNIYSGISTGNTGNTQPAILKYNHPSEIVPYDNIFNEILDQN